MRSVVAIIPPGITFDACLAAMHGMGACYPEHTLSLGNDAGGGMQIIHDPAATPPAGEPADEAGEPKTRVELALGADTPDDMLTYALSADDHEEGLRALVIWMAHQLEPAEAEGANFLTFSMDLPGVGAYGVTIQRTGGKTPAQRILELEDGPSAAAQMVAEFHEMIQSPPWTGPIEDMPLHTLRCRNKLILQEVKELILATNAGDLVAIADAIADCLYVLYGTGYTYRIPVDAVFAEVHRSNMTKEPGPTGKAVKGARYSPPDVAGVLARFAAMAATGEAVPA